MTQKRTIILDTNIWSRIKDAGAGAELRTIAHRSKLSVIAVPSVLYELAAIPAADSRAKALRLVTEMRWKRLMPEAYLESMELVEALRLHRPEWILKDPDLQVFKRLEYDWARTNRPAKRRIRSVNKAGVWERFRFDPDKAKEDLEVLGGADLEVAREDAFRGRKEMYEQEIANPGPLDTVMSSFLKPRPGWLGDPVAMWRAEALEAFTFYLFGRQEGAYFDWIAPFVDLVTLRQQRASWTKFWLYEVTEEQLSRQWIRWAMRYLARFRKVSAGTPGDVQLSAYLYDADFIASGDKLFIELVGECARFAPRSVAQGVAIRAEPTVVEQLFYVMPTLCNSQALAKD